MAFEARLSMVCQALGLSVCQVLGSTLILSFFRRPGNRCLLHGCHLWLEL